MLVAALRRCAFRTVATHRRLGGLPPGRLARAAASAATPPSLASGETDAKTPSGQPETRTATPGATNIPTDGSGGASSGAGGRRSSAPLALGVVGVAGAVGVFYAWLPRTNDSVEDGKELEANAENLVMQMLAALEARDLLAFRSLLKTATDAHLKLPMFADARTKLADWKEEFAEEMLKAMDAHDVTHLRRVLDAAINDGHHNARSASAILVEVVEDETADAKLAVAESAGEFVKKEAKGLGIPEDTIEAARLLLLHQRGLDVETLAVEYWGLDVEEAAARELAACKRLGPDGLRERVVELTKRLATDRLHARAQIQAALATHCEAMEVASLVQTEKALSNLEEDLNAEVSEEIRTLEASLLKRQEEQVEAARAEELSKAQAKHLAERDAATMAAEAATVQSLADRVSEVVAFGSGLTSLESILHDQADIMRIVCATNALSNAVVNVEDAVQSGRRASSELETLRARVRESDPFIHGLLSRLPESCEELCSREAIPTDLLLSRNFDAHLNGLVETAFAPPRSSGLLGLVLAHILPRLYVLGTSAEPDYALDSAYDEVSKLEMRDNLIALSRAASPQNADEVRTALLQLEATLGGACRAQAAPWLSDLRSTLLLRQSLQAAKARAQCLTAWHS